MPELLNDIDKTLYIRVAQFFGLSWDYKWDNEERKKIDFIFDFLKASKKPIDYLHYLSDNLQTKPQDRLDKIYSFMAVEKDSERYGKARVERGLEAEVEKRVAKKLEEKRINEEITKKEN